MSSYGSPTIASFTISGVRRMADAVASAFAFAFGIVGEDRDGLSTFASV